MTIGRRAQCLHICHIAGKCLKNQTCFNRNIAFSSFHSFWESILTHLYCIFFGLFISFSSSERDSPLHGPMGGFLLLRQVCLCTHNDISKRNCWALSGMNKDMLCVGISLYKCSTQLFCYIIQWPH